MRHLAILALLAGMAIAGPCATPIHVSAGFGVGATTGPMDTTCGTLEVGILSSFATADPPDMTSAGNTFTCVAGFSPSGARIKICYTCTPTTSNNQTFSFPSGSGTWVAMTVAVYSGQGGGPGCLVGAPAGNQTLSPGSVTPGAAGHLLVTGLGCQFCDGTQAAALNIGTVDGGGGAGANDMDWIGSYLAPNTTAVNFTWTLPSGNGGSQATLVAEFKNVAAVPTNRRRILNSGQ